MQSRFRKTSPNAFRVKEIYNGGRTPERCNIINASYHVEDCTEFSVLCGRLRPSSELQPVCLILPAPYLVFVQTNAAVQVNVGLVSARTFDWSLCFGWSNRAHCVRISDSISPSPTVPVLFLCLYSFIVEEEATLAHNCEGRRCWRCHHRPEQFINRPYSKRRSIMNMQTIW